MRRSILFVLATCLPGVVVTTAMAQELTTKELSTELATAAPSCDCLKEIKDPSVWDKSLAVGFSYTDGNSNTSNLNLSGRLSRDFEQNLWSFGADYRYEESDAGGNGPRETTGNEFLANGSYKRMLSERWFVGFGSAFRHDAIADIEYRVVLNPTAGAFIIREDSMNLSLEGGPSYTFEKLGEEEDNYFSPRIANTFDWQISRTAKLFQSAEMLFDLSDMDNYIINAEAGVDAALTSLFSLVLVLRDAYDPIPAEGKEKNDLAVIAALRVNL